MPGIILDPMKLLKEMFPVNNQLDCQDAFCFWCREDILDVTEEFLLMA